ncbi:hypothetical protein [Liberiplasma polymorphum]|uniref:hypothetical protein n=1 Tax=Liberiplasma polymorphum TaxID=3374570 RepID=UPI0037720725
MPLNNTNHYYFNLNAIRVSINGDTIISQRYMRVEGQSYNDNYLNQNYNTNDSYSLNSNEVAISSNLADKYSLNIGDTLIVTKNFIEYPFIITSIIRPFYGDFELDFNHNGLIIFPYNQPLIDQLTELRIVGYNESLSLYTSSYVLKSDLINDTQLSLVLWSFGLIIFWLFSYIVIESLFSNVVNNDVKLCVDLNYKKRQTFIYSLINTLYKYQLLFLPIIIYSVIMIFSAYISWYVILTMGMLMLFSFILLDYFRIIIIKE